MVEYTELTNENFLSFASNFLCNEKGMTKESVEKVITSFFKQSYKNKEKVNTFPYYEVNMRILPVNDNSGNAVGIIEKVIHKNDCERIDLVRKIFSTPYSLLKALEGEVFLIKSETQQLYIEIKIQSGKYLIQPNSHLFVKKSGSYAEDLESFAKFRIENEQLGNIKVTDNNYSDNYHQLLKVEFIKPVIFNNGSEICNTLPSRNMTIHLNNSIHKGGENFQMPIVY